jgi:hypothetical protein
MEYKANIGGEKTTHIQDPASPHFTVVNFTFDATLRELDVSAYVPANAIEARFYAVCISAAALIAVNFKPYGNSNFNEKGRVNNSSLSIGGSTQFSLRMTSDQKILYHGSATPSTFYLTVQSYKTR